MTPLMRWFRLAHPQAAAPCKHPSTYKRPGADGRDYVTCRFCKAVLYTVPAPRPPKPKR